MTKKKENTEIEKREPTVAERFVNKVQSEFSGSVGHGVEFSDHEKQLASNLFIKIDTQLKEQEADRVKKDKQITPFKWENVNMQKLSTDAVHIVRLGLDASIKNHVHIIPYFNGKTKQYDLDLQVGYKGKDYYRRRMAVEDVQDIRYELVHEADHFKVIKKSGRESIEDYEFDIKEPFNRGKIVGGFGYIVFKDESKNKVVLVSEEEFVKVKNKAKASNIWNEWGDKMRLKTLVHRVTDELTMDPAKINPSVRYVEDKESPFTEDPAKEVHQPVDRQEIDFDQGNGQQLEAQDQTQTEPEQDKSKSINREDVMAEITGKAKELYGKDYYKKIKERVIEIKSEASTMLDLSTDQLLTLHDEIMGLETAEA